jgi:hypothetical protein
MSKKNEDDLREALNATAEEMSLMVNNPRSWLSWIIYLLERLEEHTIRDDPAKIEIFKEMLVALQDELRNRLKTGGW